ncbi:rifin, partial [Plasmodium reichenowi]
MPNYDNDPQMKKVMEQFDDRISQRFHEYDERMIEKRKQYKERCDKEIQKIILKDKIDKELTEKFSTLETKIDTNDIPTCICEKSLAEKVEKTCLRCGRILGGGVPGFGVIGGYGAYELVQLSITAGIKAANKLGISKGLVAGTEVVIEGLTKLFGFGDLPGVNVSAMVNTQNFNNKIHLINVVMSEQNRLCTPTLSDSNLFCSMKENLGQNFPRAISTHVSNAVDAATVKVNEVTAETTKALSLEKTAEATSATTILSNPIVISFIAVVIIVILLFIIYLILRYRRKKKMKKKLQYIKLLNE